MAVDFKVECAFGHTFAESYLMRKNEVAYPEPTSSGSTDWFGSTGGGAYSVDYVSTGLPTMVKSGQRRTWTTAATTNGGGGGVWVDVSADTYRGRLYIRSSIDQVFQPYFQVYDTARTTKLSEVAVPLVSCKAWQWTEIVAPALTVPSGGGSVRILAYQSAATVDGITGSLWSVGDHFTMTGGHIERAATFGRYVTGTVYGPGPDVAGWTDISGWVTGFGSTRGRNDEFDAVEAGTLNITLDNADGRFTPQRAASPYYPNVKPMTPVRVTASSDGWATDYAVFTGAIEKWPVTLGANLSECQVTAVDLFGILGRSKLRAPLRKRWKDAGCTRLFPLNADSGFSDVISGGKDAAKFQGSSGLAPITYDGTAFYRGDGYGTGMVVTPTVSTMGAGVAFDADTIHGGDLLFMWQPDSRLTVANGDVQCLLNVQHKPGPPSPNGTGYWPSGMWVELNAYWNASASRYGLKFYATNASDGTAWAPVGDADIPLTPGQALLIHVTWYENYTPATGNYMSWNVTAFDADSGVQVGGVVGYEFYGTIFPAWQTTHSFRVGGKWNGTSMFSGQLANVGLFPNGFNADIPTLLLGTQGNPVNGMPSESDQCNEVLSQAGYSYLSRLSWGTVALAPLDWQDRKSVLEVVQSCGVDANGLMYPTADGVLGYFPGAQRMRDLRFSYPKLNDSEDYEPGVSLYVDDQNIVNDVTLEFAGGGGLDPATANAVSSASVALYDTATLSINVNLIDEDKRRDLAAWLANTRGQGGIRIESVTFPLATASVPDALLAREIGDRIGLVFPDTAPFTSGLFFIEGISVDTSAEGGTADSSITFRLSMVKPQAAWVLEDSVWGVLDDTTRPYSF